MARFHAYRAQRLLARLDALVRAFHAVVDGVAQHVVQRAFDLRQDVAVDQGVFAVDLQLHFLAQAARQVAHHARERVDAVAERAHAQGQYFVDHALRDGQQAPLIGFDVGDVFEHELLQRLRLLQRQQGFFHQARVAGTRNGFVQVLDGGKQAALVALEALQGADERVHLVRIDARFAGQRQQFIEILRRRLGRRRGTARTRRGGRLLARQAAGHGGLRLGFGRQWRRRWRSCRCWRRRQGRQFGQVGDAGDGVQGLVDLRRVGGQPGFGARVVQARQLHDQVDARQQHVDPFRREFQAAVLGGDKAVFHAVRQLHHHLQADDGGGALDRVRRAHHRFDGGRVARMALHGQQAIGENLGLAVRLHAEQVQHGKGTQVAVLVLAHRNSLAS